MMRNVGHRFKCSLVHTNQWPAMICWYYYERCFLFAAWMIHKITRSADRQTHPLTNHTMEIYIYIKVCSRDECPAIWKREWPKAWSLWMRSCAKVTHILRQEVINYIWHMCLTTIRPNMTRTHTHVIVPILQPRPPSQTTHRGQSAYRNMYY